VFIPKGVEVLCFDSLLQVRILKDLQGGFSENHNLLWLALGLRFFHSRFSLGTGNLIGYSMQILKELRAKEWGGRLFMQYFTMGVSESQEKCG
jgi:hypothetical protein